MLKIENLNVAYGDVQVLWDVNMEVEDGKIVALVGSNAAGKSTTINTISGLMKPMSGSIIFNEHKLHEMNSCRIFKGQRNSGTRRCAFLHIFVSENLERLYGSEAKKNVKNDGNGFELLPDLKMKENSLAGELSGGQQQMVAIGRGLMGNPKLLMLDEMSLGLAPLLVEQTFEIVKKINATGTTILLVEQNVQQSLAIADYAYVLENGRIVMSGLGKDLLADENLKKSYLGM